jgi:hypothetical protein
LTEKSYHHQCTRAQNSENKPKTSFSGKKKEICYIKQDYINSLNKMSLLLKSPTVEPAKKPKTKPIRQKKKGVVKPFSKEAQKTANLREKAQKRLLSKQPLSKSSKKGYSDRFPTISADNSNTKRLSLVCQEILTNAKSGLSRNLD